MNCGAKISENCTYFESTGSEVGACKVTVCRCNSNVCQVSYLILRSYCRTRIGNYANLSCLVEHLISWVVWAVVMEGHLMEYKTTNPKDPGSRQVY